MTSDVQTFSQLDARRREQTPQALARLTVVGLFISLWFVLWLARIPMPVPFLSVLLAEALFFVVYWRIVFILPNVRSVELAQYGMLASEIAFHTAMVYFLGTVSWLGAFAYVFGLIFANTFLGLRRGLVYTAGASLAFVGLILLEANGVVPHYVYLEQGALRYTDAQFVATTVLGAFGVFFSIYVWVNWVGHQLRQERDAAVRSQDDLLQARAQLQRSNEELEERVKERTAELERANTALRQSEERYRSLYTKTPGMLHSIDEDGRLVDVSDHWLAVLGYERSEVIGRKSGEFLTEESRRYAETVAIPQFMTTGSARDIAYQLVKKNGEIVDILLSAVSECDKDGNFSRSFAILTDVTERKRAEEALRESESRFRTLVEISSQGIEEINTSGVITFANAAHHSQHEYSEGELFGMSILDLVAADSERKTLREYLKYLGKEQPSPTRYFGQKKTKSGRIIDVEVAWNYKRDAEGQVTGFISFITDITERKRAEEEIRVLAKFPEENPSPVLRITGDGTIVHANEPSAPLLQAWGCQVTKRLPDHWRQLISNVLAAGSNHEVEIEAGELVFSVMFAPVVDAGYVNAYGRDITERKRVEEERRRLVSLVEHSTDFIGVASLERKTLFLNEAGRRLVGLDGDVSSVDMFDYVAEEDAGMLRDEMLPAILETGSWTGEFRFRHFTTGALIPVDVNAFTITHPETGEPTAIATVSRDATERKRVEEALREQARRDSLTGALNHAAIVHELRTLLDEDESAGSHGVAMVDVDGLKAINDTYGHQAGDEVLRAVARALSRSATATVGRYGGDEFVVILRGMDRKACQEYHDAVVADVDRANLVHAETQTAIPIVVSLGFAVYPEEAKAVAELVELADSAMYASRRQRPISTAGMTPLRDERAAQMVGEIVPLLTSAGDLNDKLQLVSQRLSEGAGYDAVNFAVVDPESEGWVANNTVADAPEHLVDAWIQEQRNDNPERHPIFSFLERTRQPVILDDPWNSELLWQPQRDILRAADLKSVLVAPMFWQDQIIGTLGVASKREAAFTSRDTQFLAAVATQVTAIVRMATLVDKLRSTSASVASAHDATVMLLASAAEARDETTGHHLQSVRALTEALASELGYGEEEALELGLAAVLHDIGKIRTPDAILSSTSSLTDMEREIMEHHASWGAQLLEGHPGFELAASVARSHHERWDGGGYPDGLSGDAIPEAAAIVTVADSFDAMISDRPYRKGRPVAEAMREIAAGSGTQFSPKVAATLLRLHTQGRLPSRSHELPGEAA